MATNNPNNPQLNPENIKEIVELEESLGRISDLYKDINKKLNVNNSTVRNINSLTTQLNNILKDTATLESKIGSEFIKEKNIQERIMSATGKQVEIEKRLSSLINSHAGNARLTVDQFISLNENLEDTEKLARRAFDEGRMADYQQHMLDIFNIEQSIQLMAEKGTSLGLKEIMILLKQKNISNEVLKILNDQDQRIIDGNKAFQKRNILQSIGNKLLSGTLKDMSTVYRQLGGGAGGGLMAYFGAGLLGAIKLVQALVELVIAADQRVTQIAKGFAMSKEEARQLDSYFFDVAASAGNVMLSTKQIAEAQMKMNELLGTNIVLNAQNLATLTKAQAVMGLSEESMKGMITYASVTGQTLENVQNTILGTVFDMQMQKGILLDNKQLLETALKTTGTIRANFKGNVTELAKAVAQAKLMGTTLENVEKTMDSLLNFETSIESELEAELLTGRAINLERARAAALTGDMSTVMSEMVKQAGDFDKFMGYNVLQQQSLAKAFGYSRAEMSDMLFEQTALERLRKMGYNDEKKSLQERYEQLKAEGKSREQMAELLGKDIALRLEQQSMQDKLNAIIDRVKDVIVKIFEDTGGMKMLENIITRIAAMLQYIGEGGGLWGLITGNSRIGEIHDEMVGKIGNVQDSVIGPNGNIMISTPKGMIRPDMNDSIITTTNPGALLNGGFNANTAELSQKLDRMIALLERGGNVYLDGRKVGTTQAMGYNAYI